MPQLRHLALALALAASCTIVLSGCRQSSPPEQADTSGDSPAQTQQAPAGTPGQPLAAAAPAMPAPPQPFGVTGVEMGSTIDSGNKIATATSAFAPDEMFYVSVATEGAAQGRSLTARWSYQNGQVFGTESKTINTTGPQHTEFHVSKTSPWPLGSYKVEILLNGAVVEYREFDVLEASEAAKATAEGNASTAAPPAATPSASPPAANPTASPAAPAPTANPTPAPIPGRG